MLKTVIILTKSRKPGGFCVAGIDTNTGDWIRIVSDTINGSDNGISRSQLTYVNGVEAEVLDVVQIHLDRYEPIYYQPENYVNDDSYHWEFVRKATIKDVLTLHPFENGVRNVIYSDTQPSLLGSFVETIHRNNAYSLTLISITNPIINVKTWDSGSKSITLGFNYNNNVYRYFRMTEGSNEIFSNSNDGNYVQKGDFALVISLGELYSSIHQPIPKHYKLIASIFKL